MVWAARSATPAADGTDPEKAGTGRDDQSAPIPNPRTTWSNSPRLRRSEAPAKAVPQSSAKAALKGLVAPVPSKVNVCPSTVKEFSQAIGEPVFSPDLSNAAADTMVNAVPGVSLAFSASAAGGEPGTWCCAMAKTCPVEAWTATITPALDALSSAARAALCTFELIVVRTGVPGTPGHRASTPAWVPAEVTATTSVVGVPSS